MNQEELLASDGNSDLLTFDYGQALLTQRGGWTIGELQGAIGVEESSQHAGDN